MDIDQKNLLITSLQQLRREYNADLFRRISSDEETKNLEDLVRLVGNLNAALEHLSVSDSADSIFCVLKHLSTALIQATEVYEDSSKVGELLAIATNNKVLPCSSCTEDIEKAEYSGIGSLD